MPHIKTYTVPEQIAQYLRREILLRRWEGVMPGRDFLAKELGVSSRSVQQSLKLLEKEGVLVAQGMGKPCKICISKDQRATSVTIAILLFDQADQGDELLITLRHRLEESGYLPFFTKKTLNDLSMDVDEVARFVERTPADCWLVVAGSKELLTWFSQQATPAFAIAGRRRGVQIAGAGPNKVPMFAEITRLFLKLGHKRISYLCRNQLRLPTPGKSSEAFINELKAAKIVTGSFHLPNWKESSEGFASILDSLFGPTPPTALILDEAVLFNAAYHHITRLGLRVPEDVSMICADPDPIFAWCQPSIAHIHWDHGPIIRQVIRWVDNVSKGKKDLTQHFQTAQFFRGGTIAPPKSTTTS